MADKNDDSFLGGGIKFNSAGVGAPANEPVPEVEAQGLQPHQIRTAIIAVVVVLMVVALFAISIQQYENSHGSAHRGVSPANRPAPVNESAY